MTEMVIVIDSGGAVNRAGADIMVEYVACVLTKQRFHTAGKFETSPMLAEQMCINQYFLWLSGLSKGKIYANCYNSCLFYGVNGLKGLVIYEVVMR